MANRFLATFYLANGRLADAEASLKVAAEISPDTTGRLALADYYLGVKRASEAKPVLERLAAEPAGFAPARLRQANLRLSEGDRPGAYALIDEVLAKESSHAEALVARAELERGDGKLDAAMRDVEAAAKAQPSSAPIQFLKGRILAARLTIYPPQYRRTTRRCA